jgi:hypothetical protein
MLRSARDSGGTDHVLSMILFVAMLIEFMAVKAVLASTLFLLLVISFVDVAGFAVSIRATVARRDILMTETRGGGAGAGA